MAFLIWFLGACIAIWLLSLAIPDAFDHDKQILDENRKKQNKPNK